MVIYHQTIFTMFQSALSCSSAYGMFDSQGTQILQGVKKELQDSIMTGSVLNPDLFEIHIVQISSYLAVYLNKTWNGATCVQQNQVMFHIKINGLILIISFVAISLNLINKKNKVKSRQKNIRNRNSQIKQIQSLKNNGRKNTIIFKNKRQIKKMQSPRSPQHFSASKGKIRPIQSYSQTKLSSVVTYTHTLRPYPDEYHIEAIKQYKKELDEIRRNFQELRRLYYYLLGYRIKGDDRIPRLSFALQKNNVCVTEVSQNESLMRYSISEVNQALTDIAENSKKIDNLNQQLTQSIIQYKPDYLKFPHTSPNKTAHKNKTRTQNDEQIEQQLQSVLKQNKILKDRIENTRISYNHEVKQIKQSYEEHIRKLEEILERERRHTKMLNGVIERMRSELVSKDNFIRNVVKVKNVDKNGVEKLLRQLKIGVCG